MPSISIVYQTSSIPLSHSEGRQIPRDCTIVDLTSHHTSKHECETAESFEQSETVRLLC
jgi:hypothetical protein